MTKPRLHRIPCPSSCKAEGDITDPRLPAPIPYDSDIADSSGCRIHLWMGEHTDGETLDLAIRIARYNRDVVEISYSDGAPAGYWCVPANMTLRT